MTSSSATTTIVIIAVNPFERTGCKSMLEQDPQLQVLADAAHPDELVPGLQPDLLVIVPEAEGHFDAGTALVAMQMYPDAGVLLLSDACKDDFYFPYGSPRGVSMLSRSCQPSTLRHTVHIAADRKVRVTDRALFDRMLEERRVAREVGRSGSQIRLTPREREIVSLMANGLNDSEIARTLGVSKSAIQTHIDNALEKAPVSTRFEFALYAHTTGLVEYRLPSLSNTRP